MPVAKSESSLIIVGAFAVLHSLVLERLEENIAKNMLKRLPSYKFRLQDHFLLLSCNTGWFNSTRASWLLIEIWLFICWKAHAHGSSHLRCCYFGMVFCHLLPWKFVPNSINEYEIQSLRYVSKYRRGSICGCDLMCNTPTDEHWFLGWLSGISWHC